MTGCRHLYYKLIDWFADTPQIARFTGYGLYDAEFIDVLRQIGDIQPYFKTVVAEYGIGLEIVQYDQAQSSRGSRISTSCATTTSPCRGSPAPPSF